MSKPDEIDFLATAQLNWTREWTQRAGRAPCGRLVDRAVPEEAAAQAQRATAQERAERAAAARAAQDAGLTAVTSGP